MEEADELCRANTAEELAFEAADLLYFALTRCIAWGVSLADIARSLDEKAKKVTRTGTGTVRVKRETLATRCHRRARAPEWEEALKPEMETVAFEGNE